MILFNIFCKVWYDPGLLPISVWYFSTIWGQHLYGGWDISLAIVWIAFNYLLVFRGPIYNKLGSMSGRYAFPRKKSPGENGF